MKQTKWQRLATIGLCSSLVINAFSGVTAVAETITIESSPTVASSAKEATSASSATQASTESSQETTETSREEVTQETEKQAEVAAEKKEAPPVKAEHEKAEAAEENQSNSVPLPVNGLRSIVGNTDNYSLIYDELANFLNRPRVNSDEVALSVPELNLGFNVEETNGTPVNAKDFNLSASINFLQSIPPNSSNAVTIDRENVLATKESNSLNFKLPSKTIVTYSDPYVNHSFNFYYLDKMNLTVPKYVNSVDVSGGINQLLSRTGSAHVLQLINPSETSIAQITMTKINDLTFSLSTNPGMLTHFYENAQTVQTVGTLPYLLMIGYSRPNLISLTASVAFPKTSPKIIVDLKKVTENFVDATGAKITPPTGFTQGQQTSITSNDFTYTSTKALPDTYKASNGKTYKFKGWYKGKTKPNTLTTTKAPSYTVTYDDNDDLNVVYEEVNFPETTYQFGFVNEAGQLVNPEDINLTYDYKSIVFRGTGGAGSTVSFATIANNQSGAKVGNLRQVTLPAKNIAQPTATGWNGDAFTNFSIKLPKYYKSLNLYDKTGKIDPKYPLPVKTTVSSASNNTVQPEANVIAELTLTQRADGSFTPRETSVGDDASVRYPPFLRRYVIYSSGSTTAVHQTISGPVYYHLTNRKVTENFVNTSGAKITPPTGFTQGKQTVINSDPYTFKQSGTLPDTYTTGGKTYKFKGWYKGKTKPSTLTTTKAPSYAVTYDDNDDLNVVYEEATETDVYPGFYAQFVDEQGKAFTNPLTFSGNYTEYLRKTGTTVFETAGAFYPMIGKRDATVTNKYKIETTSSVAVPNNFWTPMPADIGNRGYALNNLDITNQMKYVDKIEATDTRTTMYDYAGIADIGVNLNNTSQTELNAIDKTFVKQANSTFSMNTKWGDGTFSQIVPRMLLLGEISRKPRLFGFDGTPDYKHTMNYTVTRKQVTENFVNTNGTKITPPTGFTQGNQIPMTSNTFKYTAAKALPATYTAGGKTYTFQGWYKGKTKPTTLTTSTTPTYNTTFDGNDDMTAMYKEEVPKASVALTRTTAETVTSGGNVTWRATITNTSQAPLTTATIKKSTAWTTGLAAPTAMIVTPAGGTAKTVPVTATTWTNGVSLGTDIPVGKSATVQFTTKATGTAGQVLRAGITTSGNYSGVSASATVRVKDNDQAIVTPTAEGFISVPTFNFGQVDVASATKQHGLKKAADYYGNGTRNPYLRIKKTQ
ncbi:hypothetical protein ACJQ42_002636, partial [Enterococcus faecalis]